MEEVRLLGGCSEAAALQQLLEERGHTTEVVSVGDSQSDARVLIVAASGLTREAIEWIRGSLAPVIIFGDNGATETVLELVSTGVASHASTADSLELALLRTLHKRQLQREIAGLQTVLAESTGFEELIGVSPIMQRLFEDICAAAESQSSVLVTGESGTGKELIARALHQRSARADGPFIAINCAAIPETLIESELFGHVKGAFTSANTTREGLLLRARGGTIFLDEIGELPVAMQPKLLRTLQERTVRAVGSDSEAPFDARVIAATNVNLEQAIADRIFREDLYYRINVIHLEVPPLRERPADILLIAEHYLRHFSTLAGKMVEGFSREAADRLLHYTWPGNVRELQNCIERAVAMSKRDSIQVEDMPQRVRSFKRSHLLVVGTDPNEMETLAQVERRYIARVYQAVGGNKKRAAEVLGLDRKTLYRKLEKYGIES